MKVEQARKIIESFPNGIEIEPDTVYNIYKCGHAIKHSEDRKKIKNRKGGGVYRVCIVCGEGGFETKYKKCSGQRKNCLDEYLFTTGIREGQCKFCRRGGKPKLKLKQCIIGAPPIKKLLKSGKRLTKRCTVCGAHLNHFYNGSTVCYDCFHSGAIPDIALAFSHHLNGHTMDCALEMESGKVCSCHRALSASYLILSSPRSYQNFNQYAPTGLGANSRSTANPAACPVVSSL